MDPITAAFKAHHEKLFKEHGATPRGLDWSDTADTELRYAKMLEVIESAEASSGRRPTLLDVGCGYGGLFEYARLSGVALDYTGIDLVSEMVDHAASAHVGATFVCGDFLASEFDTRFDYVVCSGIMTQKLKATRRAMAAYVRAAISKMYGLCERGIAFNMMSTNVNFMVDNLYYASPVEMLAFCFSDITNRVRIDHAYRLFYEYTMYLYRPGSEDAYGP